MRFPLLLIALLCSCPAFAITIMADPAALPGQAATACHTGYAVVSGMPGAGLIRPPRLGMAGAPLAFDELDSNKDGAVSSEEYQACAAEFFKQVDRNHDGMLDPQEMALIPSYFR